MKNLIKDLENAVRLKKININLKKDWEERNTIEIYVPEIYPIYETPKSGTILE